MRKAKVLYKNKEAGELTQLDDASFVFEYNKEWLSDENCPPISLSFPKKESVFSAKSLFPFFYHLLPEGKAKKEISQKYKIDEEDAFGILLHSAQYDTIGAIKIIKI